MTGIDIKHIPYRGGGPALNDVVAGHVPMMFGDVGPVTGLASQRSREGARGHRRQAGRDHARRADHDRGGACRLRGEFVAEHGRAGKPAAADRDDASTRRSPVSWPSPRPGGISSSSECSHCRARRRNSPTSSASRDQKMGAGHQGGRRNRADLADRGRPCTCIAEARFKDHHRARGSIRDRYRAGRRAADVSGRALHSARGRRAVAHAAGL